MKISRRFTRSGENVFDSTEWSSRSSRITNADGSLVFEMNDAEIPADWSQLATDIVVSKYFRKAGIPQRTRKADGSYDLEGEFVRDDKGEIATGPECSVRQVVDRLAGCWRDWGFKNGYFSTSEDAQAFYDELAYMLVNQMAAPNSPQWFNTGLSWAYGIEGPPQGHWIAEHETGELSLAPDAYSHPQPHACFIQSVSDDLVGEGGIMNLWVREARLFKYGSGTGTNFSSIRGENEPLSGGGRSSGLMSFLKIGDRAAGAIKSGGTTRRAAKMVCLDVDHPDVESFINWKVREEIKVAALVEGMKHLGEDQKEVAESLGLELDYDFNGEAYFTVSGQNSNNSVRLSDEFFDAVENDEEWVLKQRTDGEPAKTLSARKLWGQIAFAAWRCADPGIQYDSTINAWHTCPEGGRINASNPCSEYMFLDNTACNLASINLMKFYDSTTRSFDIEGFEHAVGIWTIVLEISVMMAAFPSREIAELSWRYRTLGLGYANLGAMLMQAGIPYDTDEGRAVCGAISAIMTGRSYAASALLAAEHGPFDGFRDNRSNMLRVIRNHRRAAHGVEREAGDWEELRIPPVPVDHGLFRDGRVKMSNAQELLDRCMLAWDDALRFGEKFGYRNAQVTVIAPTGTIGLLMDCDTTGVEPDFALTKFKKLAGGGYFKIANQSLRPALFALGYETTQVDDIITWVMGSLDLDVPMPSADGTMGGNEGTLREFLATGAGYTGEDLVALENLLPTVFELSFAFNAWSIPEHVLEGMGIDVEQARQDSAFNGLKALGLTTAQVDILNRLVCGTQTIEGAPHLKDEDLAVFDCANRCGTMGKRFIAPQGHIRMMAAAQPFISGAISKTINLPNEAEVEDISESYLLSWRLGLKANALYRDGCKLSQPLSTSSGDENDATEEEAETTETSVVKAEAPEPSYIETIVEKITKEPYRKRLPDTRESLTHKFNVAGHEGYLIVGLYENGKPGELFITMAKEGSTIGGLMDSLGTAISVALQYGVPVQSLVTKFAHQRFEPMGITSNNDIPFAKSLVDYIFRWLGIQFIEGYREQNTPNRGGSPAASMPGDRNSHVTEDKKSWTQEASSSDSPTRPLSGDRGKTVPTTSTSTAPNAMSSGRKVEVEPSSPDGNATGSQKSQGSVLDQLNVGLMGDAPACDVCGSITVRNGTCYKCNNCGNSMGCS